MSRPTGLGEYSTEELIAELNIRGVRSVTFRSGAYKLVGFSDQYKCPSYYDDEGALQDCRCGKCGEPHNTPLNADVSQNPDSDTPEANRIVGDTQEPRDLIQICTDIYYECETIKRLDELTDEALDWHNKQIEAVLDRLESNMPRPSYVSFEKCRTAEDYKIRQAERVVARDASSAIEAERNRLKGAGVEL